METKFKNITLFFSIVSLIITLLGVYSAITLDTERRQKEVAIRKINGAGIKTDYLTVFPVVYVTFDNIGFISFSCGIRHSPYVERNISDIL